ncbi:MAG: class I SAM-dependent methyltransferase [Rhizomicrobium sp.]
MARARDFLLVMASIPITNDWQFLREFLAQPLKVASPIASGRTLARRIAAQIDPDPGGAVLELGPGTGSVTRAIRERGVPDCELIGIESDRQFVLLLRRQLPDIRVIEGDAFGFARLLGREGRSLRTIVSGLPVLGRPPELRRQFLRDALAALKPGRPLIQFSYGLYPPLPPVDGVEVQRGAFVWLNLPPMQIWVYRRAK